MNPNNNKRGAIRSNMPSTQSRLAKIAALDSFKESLRQLQITEFTYNEIERLLGTLWADILEERKSKLDKVTCPNCGK